MQIGEVAKPIILDWVIAQHSRILEWTGRASDFEVGSMWSWMIFFNHVLYNSATCLVKYYFN